MRRMTDPRNEQTAFFFLGGGLTENHMLNGESWIYLTLSWLFGSSAGFVLDHVQRERHAGRRLAVDWRKMLFFLLLGAASCGAVFALLAADHTPQAWDFVIAGLAGLKGFEVLSILGGAVTRIARSLLPDK
jgi:hypothetical protein